MEYEPKDVMVLGAIRNGAKNFGKIQKATKIETDELNGILERLEKRGMIVHEEKKGWLGKKMELSTTPKGDNEVEHRIHEMEENWQQMVQLYKSGDKGKLNKQMDGFRSFFPMMMFFGIMDIMMFSMMFSMIGASMTDYVPADQMPGDMDGGGADGADGGAGADGGFDFDIGF
ncbi:conserved hypothetical protein [Cenarchaeum symbiosum A]|uniref:HTH hxlR-type domain-containing protein n=1 Tax=Cenarchaeum symbiosum (strain A) TaxID=414004 RepID=A0RX94_CENSY|nr:conserved hypothetical protein [Cenarchaeum symbiosum A]